MFSIRTAIQWEQQFKRCIYMILGAQVLVATLNVPSVAAMTSPTTSPSAMPQILASWSVNNSNSYECPECGGPEGSSGAGGH